MAKDPAFLFYPGDYLRDTQSMSEKSQVAYDRIMCEHMRNIMITKEQLNFFTKRLNEDEKQEIEMTLTKIRGGYYIEWVADSIAKRRAFSDSRANNRRKKEPEKEVKDMKRLVNDMEIENEIVNESKKEPENKKRTKKNFIPPTVDEVKKYFKENGYKEEAGEKAHKYYSVAEWIDSKGNPVKNWKQKMQGVWFKEENKDLKTETAKDYNTNGL